MSDLPSWQLLSANWIPWFIIHSCLLPAQQVTGWWVNPEELNDEWNLLFLLVWIVAFPLTKWQDVSVCVCVCVRLRIELEVIVSFHTSFEPGVIPPHRGRALYSILQGEKKQDKKEERTITEPNYRLFMDPQRPHFLSHWAKCSYGHREWSLRLMAPGKIVSIHFHLALTSLHS